jgi:hypothetical protein
LPLGEKMAKGEEKAGTGNPAFNQSGEFLAKVTCSVIPAKAGIQNCSKNWIPGLASLARNDAFLLLSRVLQEDPVFSILGM